VGILAGLRTVGTTQRMYMCGSARMDNRNIYIYCVCVRVDVLCTIGILAELCVMCVVTAGTRERMLSVL